MGWAELKRKLPRIISFRKLREADTAEPVAVWCIWSIRSVKAIGQWVRRAYFEHKQ